MLLSIPLIGFSWIALIHWQSDEKLDSVVSFAELNLVGRDWSSIVCAQLDKFFDLNMSGNLLPEVIGSMTSSFFFAGKHCDAIKQKESVGETACLTDTALKNMICSLSLWAWQRALHMHDVLWHWVCSIWVGDGCACCACWGFSSLWPEISTPGGFSPNVVAHKPEKIYSSTTTYFQVCRKYFWWVQEVSQQTFCFIRQNQEQEYPLILIHFFFKNQAKPSC